MIKTYPEEEIRHFNALTHEFIHRVPLRPGDRVKTILIEGEPGDGLVVSIVDGYVTVLWSSEPFDPFSTFAMPLIRRVFPTTIAQDIVQIQPLTLPAGLVLYLDYTYGNAKSKLDKRCVEGPWVSRIWWRSFRCLKTHPQRFWSSLRSSSRSLFGRLASSGGTLALKQLNKHGYVTSTAHQLTQENPVMKNDE